LRQHAGQIVDKLKGKPGDGEIERFRREPERLGEAATRRIEREGLPRTVCDYIAGMTDRYLLEEFARISASSRAERSEAEGSRSERGR